MSLFLGVGTERNFSETLSRTPGDWSRDFVLGAAVAREIARPLPQLGVEAEALYGFHFGRQRYHEVALGLYGRWHEFPWNAAVATTFAVGVGPSFTTRHPELERRSGSDDRSRLLNQFNLEITVAAPDLPRHALLLRLQHRSGVFGMFNGVHDGSNFLSVGTRSMF